jgi:hypothetical protein
MPDMEEITMMEALGMCQYISRFGSGEVYGTLHITTLLGAGLQEREEGYAGEVDGGDIAMRISSAFACMRGVGMVDVRVVCLAPLLKSLVLPKLLLELGGIFAVWLCLGS